MNKIVCAARSKQADMFACLGKLITNFLVLNNNGHPNAKLCLSSFIIKMKYKRWKKLSWNSRRGQQMYLCNIGSIDQCCRRTRWPLTLKLCWITSRIGWHTRFASTFHHFTTASHEPMVRVIKVHAKREWFFHIIKTLEEKNMIYWTAKIIIGLTAKSTK